MDIESKYPILTLEISWHYLKTEPLLTQSLKKHLAQLLSRNGTYLSPSSQNEIINVIGFDIHANILKEVKEAKFYAILAD